MDFKQAQTDIEKKYPISEREEKMLTNELFGSGAVFIVFGIIFSIVYTGWRTDNWTWSFGMFGWAYEFGQAMLLGSTPVIALLAAICAPALLILINEMLLHNILWKHSQKYRDDVKEVRLGVSGEIPRMALTSRIAIAVSAGFSEEFSFRYALTGVLSVLFCSLFDSTIAMGVAVVITSMLFASVHSQYGRMWERIVIFVYAIVFGVILVVTGSLLAAVIAHVLYDFAVMELERRRMMNDPDYFGEAEAPDHVVEAQLKELDEYVDKLKNHKD